MTPEERVDVLAEALAQGFLYLAENGLIETGQEGANHERINNAPESEKQPLISVGNEGSPSFKGGSTEVQT
ncbi:MAG: hypothetical protein HY549_12415 [Elusimicrobia bacterium]|nr:hypothetical protein [Elusimicrobiota bacterium]